MNPGHFGNVGEKQLGSHTVPSQIYTLHCQQKELEHKGKSMIRVLHYLGWQKGMKRH